mgnify:CR=1 FL=1
MDYLILTENEFFRLIHNRQDCSGVDAAYNEFVKCVVELCSGCHDLHHSLFAMTYAEIELQYHEMQNAAAASESGLNVYVRKALAFIRKMLKLLTIQVPPLTSTSFNSCLRHFRLPLDWKCRRSGGNHLRYRRNGLYQ